MQAVWHGFCQSERQPVADEIQVKRLRVAIPDWNGRVSPVFDAAEHLLVVDCVNGKESARHCLMLAHHNPDLRVTQLADLGVNLLVCGAVSTSLRREIDALGIVVIDGVCGETTDVLRAVLCNGDIPPPLCLPGTAHRRAPLLRATRRRKKRKPEKPSHVSAESPLPVVSKS
jgi:predicted Fe-Mo cluster-binding NifX family protein